MRKVIFRENGKIWPTVTWRDSDLVVYYLGNDDECVRVEETRKIDFEELLLRIDRGESAFITLKPRIEEETSVL